MIPIFKNGIFYIAFVVIIDGKAKLIGKEIARAFWMPPKIKLLPPPKDQIE